MAPVPSPPEQKESFALDGTGVLLLTEEQRQAKTLSISVEKVALGPRVEYYNFRTPEPQGFWGYLQLVRRDFVEETIQLEYRRQLVYSWHQPVLDPIEQLRCLVKDSTLLLFDNLTPLLLSAGGDAQQIGQDRANYLLKNGQPRLIPVAPVTGIYYEIEPNRAALVTLIWRGYSLPCEQPLPPQIQESPRTPGKDESGPGGNDGGGTRPAEPPPPERSSDPDSDNAAPPPETGGGPPIPTPEEPEPPVATTVTWVMRLCLRNGPNNTWITVDSAPKTGTGIGPFVVTRSSAPGGIRSELNDSTGKFFDAVVAAFPNECGIEEGPVIISQS